MLVVLGDAKIFQLDDFAELASDELTSSEDGILRDFNLDEEQANAMIMAARAHWFQNDTDNESTHNTE